MEKQIKKRQPCEVFSRVVGYLRPVKQWNDSKQSEFDDRRAYKVSAETLEQKFSLFSK